MVFGARPSTPPPSACRRWALDRRAALHHGPGLAQHALFGEERRGARPFARLGIMREGILQPLDRAHALDAVDVARERGGGRIGRAGENRRGKQEQEQREQCSRWRGTPGERGGSVHRISLGWPGGSQARRSRRAKQGGRRSGFLFVPERRPGRVRTSCRSRRTTRAAGSAGHPPAGSRNPGG